MEKDFILNQRQSWTQRDTILITNIILRNWGKAIKSLHFPIFIKSHRASHHRVAGEKPQHPINHRRCIRVCRSYLSRYLWRRELGPIPSLCQDLEHTELERCLECHWQHRWGNQLHSVSVVLFFLGGAMIGGESDGCFLRRGSHY